MFGQSASQPVVKDMVGCSVSLGNGTIVVLAIHLALSPHCYNAAGFADWPSANRLATSAVKRQRQL